MLEKPLRFLETQICQPMCFLLQNIQNKKNELLIFAQPIHIYMVEKRVLDKILAKALKKNEHIKWIFLIDKEGFPISCSVRSKEFRINPQQYASILRFLFAPSSMFSSGLQLGDSLVGMTFFKEDILVEINLGNGLLGIMHRIVGWPIPAEEINDLLTELKIHLPELTYLPSGLLKELKAQMGGVQKTVITDQQIVQINELFNALMRGKLEKKDYTITKSDQEYYIDLGENIASNQVVKDLIITTNEQNSQNIFEHNGSAQWLGNPTKLLINSYSAGLKKANLSEAMFHVYFFNSYQTVITSPISQHDKTLVYLTASVEKWNEGFLSVITPLYRALLTLVPVAPSKLTEQLKETFDFFSSTAEDLKSKIDKLLAEGNSGAAINYMERCAKLYSSQNNYIMAGDYYKWAGYTNYEGNNLDKSTSFYLKATDMHRKGRDLSKVVEDYCDLASVLESFTKYKESLDYYSEANKIAKQLGDTQTESEIQVNIDRIIAPLSTPIAEYINKDSASNFQLSRLSQKFDLPEHIIILALEYLIKNQKIMGHLDMNSRLYTKRKESMLQSVAPIQASAAQSITSSDFPSAANGSGQPIIIAGLITPRSTPQFTYQFAVDQVAKIQSDNAKNNAELTKIEAEFKRKNVKITDFLKYQTYLNRKKFNDQKITIYDNMLKMNADNSQPILCFVCLKAIEPDDIISVCPKGHGAHDNCLATWIQTQQKCPVCSEKIMPFMLQLTYAKYANAIFNPGYVIGLQKELESALNKLNFLKTLDPQNLDLFQRAAAEREDKRQLEKTLSRKEQELDELKNLLKSYKDQLAKRNVETDSGFEF